MNNALVLLSAAIVGALLGTLFFGGLWWTVRQGLSSARPALWFLASTVVRTGVAVLGFYVVGGGHWPRLVACLIGFMVARTAVMRLTQKGLHATHA